MIMTMMVRVLDNDELLQIFNDIYFCLNHTCDYVRPHCLLRHDCLTSCNRMHRNYYDTYIFVNFFFLSKLKIFVIVYALRERLFGNARNRDNLIIAPYNAHMI